MDKWFKLTPAEGSNSPQWQYMETDWDCNSSMSPDTVHKVWSCTGELERVATSKVCNSTLQEANRATVDTESECSEAVTECKTIYISDNKQLAIQSATLSRND